MTLDVRSAPSRTSPAFSAAPRGLSIRHLAGSSGLHGNLQDAGEREHSSPSQVNDMIEVSNLLTTRAVGSRGQVKAGGCQGAPCTFWPCDVANHETSRTSNRRAAAPASFTRLLPFSSTLTFSRRKLALGSQDAVASLGDPRFTACREIPI